MTFRQKLQRRGRKAAATSALNKISPYEVIKAPLMTEKAHAGQEEELKKYTFKVHSDANKNDVKAAIMYIYKVEPLKINMLNAKYKKRQQRGMVKREYKKAIVTL
jgi:large subunit ribosomal protein L23